MQLLYKIHSNHITHSINHLYLLDHLNVICLMFFRFSFSILCISLLLSCESHSPKQADEAVRVQSTLEIFSIDSATRQIIYQADENFEAPNWSRDDSFLLFNMKGEIYRILTTGGTPTKVNTGFATHCNNDRHFTR